MRIRAKDRGLGKRLRLAVARPLIQREWQGHFAVLRRVLREDATRADEAAGS